MKITKGDVVITDVPGIDSITVKRHPDAAAGVRIVIEDSRGEPLDWGLDGLTQYRDALSAAIDAARELSGQKDVPRVFRRGDDIPADVVKVRDREGDLWEWNEDQLRWETRGASSCTAEELLDVWAPATEVRG